MSGQCLHYFVFVFKMSQLVTDINVVLLKSKFSILGMLKSLGIKDSELGDVKFFLEKLVNTGFLD